MFVCLPFPPLKVWLNRTKEVGELPSFPLRICFFLDAFGQHDYDAKVDAKGNHAFTLPRSERKFFSVKLSQTKGRPRRSQSQGRTRRLPGRRTGWTAQRAAGGRAGCRRVPDQRRCAAPPPTIFLLLYFSPSASSCLLLSPSSSPLHHYFSWIAPFPLFLRSQQQRTEYSFSSCQECFWDSRNMHRFTFSF